MDQQHPASAAAGRQTGTSVGTPDVSTLRLLIESTIDYAIFLLDTSGHITSWNAGAERIKGYSAEEIVGRHFSMFYTKDAIDRGWPDYELTEAARVGRFEDEGWRLRKDGTRFWANVVITALRDAQGTLRGFGKVTRDLSERRASEQRVEQLKSELERRVAELGAINRELRDKSAENESFVYSVSHDLRSPLVNLQGFSQELRLTSRELEELFADPRVPSDLQQKGLGLVRTDLAESTQFIQDAVRQLSAIIDGLLRLSRVGRIEYHFDLVDMNKVVAEILAAMHATVSKSGAEVRVLPLPMIEADRSAAGQVFANVVGNALKNLAEGRPGLIEIGASDAEVPVFWVRDNGIGIPLEFQSKIFRVFQHVHETPRRGEGMGLAIVRRILERHGGRIWLESIPGTGTTFFFTFAGQRVGRAGSASERR